MEMQNILLREIFKHSTVCFWLGQTTPGLMFVFPQVKFWHLNHLSGKAFMQDGGNGNPFSK